MQAYVACFIWTNFNFFYDLPVGQQGDPNCDSTAVQNKPVKNRRRADIAPRFQRSFDRNFEKGFRGRDLPENRRPCPTENRTPSDGPVKPECEPEDWEKIVHLAEQSPGKTRPNL